MIDVLLTLAAIALLILLQGFFSGSEIALVNADKLKLRHRAKQGHAGSRLVMDMFQRPERLLGTTLVGTNIAVVTSTTLGTLLFIRQVGTGGEILAFLVFMPLLLIFGEIVPKSVYQQKADTLAPIIIYPIRFFSFLFFPLIWVFAGIAGLAVRWFGSGTSSKRVFMGREKIRTLLESSEQSMSGSLDRNRIRRAVRFSDVTAGDAMIPISDTVVFNNEHDLDRAVELVRKSGYNILPVFDGDSREAIGILELTTWDLLDPQLSEHSVNDFLKPAHFAAINQPVEQLLNELQARSDHMAIVVDEYGSTVGVITVEDIVEEVVGDIEDVDFRMKDRHSRNVEMLSEKSYLVDAHLPIPDLNDLLDIDVSEEYFHSVGGLLMAQLKRLPEVDEWVEEAGYRFTVVEADERMVRRVRIEPAFEK